MPENIPARQARQAEYYQQKKAAGLVTVRDWCYPEDRETLHYVARRLREQREEVKRREAKMPLERAQMPQEGPEAVDLGSASPAP